MLLSDDFGGEYLNELGVLSKIHRNRIMQERRKLLRYIYICRWQMAAAGW
jgi:hypothetical protein